MTAPAWVHKRDGRLVPFEADKISRSLFAATEEIGRPDAFLARELTDGVLHFLSGEAEERIPTTADVAELVTKVVRELGQPALARAYADFTRTGKERPAKAISLQFAPTDPLPSILADCRRAYALNAVFTRDLAAAQQDGLLTLAGLDAPLELAASTPAPLAPLVERLLEVRQHTAGVVALDGVEHTLARSPLSAESAAAGFVRELEAGLGGTGLRAVVNLNVPAPPPWADDLADGPLFAGQRSDADPGRLAALADALLPALAHGSAPARIDWHLSEQRLRPRIGRAPAPGRPAGRGRRGAGVRLRPTAPPRRPGRGHRPQAPGAAADGRPAPAAPRRTAGRERRPGAVPAKARQPGAAGAECRGAEARLPAPPCRRPAGADARLLPRPRPADGGTRRTRRRRATAHRQGIVRRQGAGVRPSDRAAAARGAARGRAGVPHRHLPRRARRVHLRRREPGEPSAVAGLTPWDATAPVKAQLRAAGALHAAAEGGTAAVLLDAERPPSAEQVVEWLRGAWAGTDVGRVCFVRPAAAHRQLTLSV